MMKWILICSLSSFLSSVKPVPHIQLGYLRDNYEKAVSVKKLCETIIRDLKRKPKSNVHLAYLGAFQTIWANHVFNPFSKLKTFSKGKANIELAVKNEDSNAEIRFIRLSVQKNCPGFLGYNDNIEKDKLFLKNHLDEVQPPQLKEMIKNILTK